MRRASLFILAIFFGVLVFGGRASAQTNEAMERGLLAAKEKEWVLAIKYFKEAQEKAPLEPKILFNLALASDKTGDRLLFSLAYYRVYLVLAPDAENAKQVATRIRELEVKLEAEAQNFIRKAKEALKQVEVKDSGVCYAGIARAMIGVGDIPGALSFALTNPLDVYTKGYDFGLIAAAQAQAGNFEDAKDTARKLASAATDDLARSSALDRILGVVSDGQANKNDFSAAKKTTESISGIATRNYCYEHIAESQAEAGDFAAAEQTVTFIKDDDDCLSQTYSFIAKAKAEAGDLAGAKKYIQLAKESVVKAAASVYLEASSHDGPRLKIAIAELAAGEIDAAKKTFDTLTKEEYTIRSYTLDFNRALALALAKSGKVSEAKKVVSGMSDFYFKAKTYKMIVELQIKNKDIPGAQSTVDIIEPKDIKYAAQGLVEQAAGRTKQAKAYAIYALMNDPAFKEMEDFPDFIQSFKAKEPKWVCWSLANTATNLALFSRQLREIGEKK